MAGNLERIFFLAENFPLVNADEVQVVDKWFDVWKSHRIEIIIVTPEQKEPVEELWKRHDLMKYLEAIISLEAPQKYPTVGALMHNGLRREGWVPREQIICTNSTEAARSIWIDEAGKLRRCALAHTFRYDKGGESLAMPDSIFKEVNTLVFADHPKTTEHTHIVTHGWGWITDKHDNADKCEVDLLPEGERKAKILAMTKDGDKSVIRNRVDLSELAGLPEYSPAPGEEAPAPAPAATGGAPGSKPKPVWGTPPAAPSATATTAVTNGIAPPMANGAGRKSVTGQGAKKTAPKRTITIYEVHEGMDVVIGDGPDAGTQGTIVKVTGEGKDKRFRVQLETGKSTWTTKVRGIGMDHNIQETDVPTSRPPVVSPLMAALNGGIAVSPGGKAGGKGKGPGGPPPAGGAAGGAKAGKDEKEEFPEGTNVEVLAGPHKGKCGQVVKISGEGKEKKYRVQMEAGGPSSWVVQVKKATRALEAAVEVVQIEDLYEVEKKKLGSGAFGSVTKVKNRATGLVRAMKNIRKPMVKNIEVIWKEVAFMRRLDHPNIIKVYDTFEDARSVYLIMEIATGGELFDRIISDGAFVERQAATVMQHILRGLFYMHSKKICHRDLKPENFLLTSKEPVDKTGLKIIDFGIAHDFPEPGETLKSRVGSSYYVAPEVLQAKYNESADMWSYGVITYLVLSGTPPFGGDTDDEIESKVCKGVYDFDDSVWTNVSDDAKDFIRKLIVMDWQKGRMTAGQAMQHTWIVNKAPKSQPKQLEGTMSNLKAFQSQTKLKKIALQVIANQCSDDQLASLRENFQALDLNGDGFLTVEELKSGMEKVGLDAIPELHDIMAQVDFNKSGKVDYTEFLGASLDTKTYLQEDICWGAFRVFDKNGDGKISKDELAEVLKDADVRDVVGGDLEQMMAEIDQNNDGEVDFKEFMAMMKHGA